MSKSRRRSGFNDSKSNTIDGPVAGHKLLVDPNVFNISLLLPPSLGFLQRLKDIVPPDSDIAMSTLTSFLDDFLVNVFQPQLEETVTELCTQAFIELDAFQKDAWWSQKASRPLFKVASPTLGPESKLTSKVGNFNVLRAHPGVLQIAPSHTTRPSFHPAGSNTNHSLLQQVLGLVPLYVKTAAVSTWDWKADNASTCRSATEPGTE